MKLQTTLDKLKKQHTQEISGIDKKLERIRKPTKIN